MPDPRGTPLANDGQPTATTGSSPADTPAGHSRFGFLPPTGEPRYGLVLTLILLTLGAAAFSGDSIAAQVLIAALEGATFLVALATSGARRLLVVLVGAAVVGVVVVVAISSATPDSAFRGAVVILATIVVAATPVAILRRLRYFTRVDRQVVMGAVSVYLLVGFLFTQIYRSVDTITGGPIFAQIADPDGVDMLYYSFITMATVGYGDLTPTTDTMRMLAVLEALTGQLYLVTVVALVVSNLGRIRSQPIGHDPSKAALGAQTPEPPREPSD